MRVVLVGMGVESLGIEALSAYLKKHQHKVKLVFDPRLFASEAISFKKLASFFDTSCQLVEEILNFNPALVGFSVFSLNYQRALKLAREIKRKRKVAVIFGGIHPTCVPEVVIREKEVDMVCVGEGEEAMAELLGAWEKRDKRTDIKNIWFKKGKKLIRNSLRRLIEDLDGLPFLDKDLFYEVYSGFMDDYYTISSRGCPFSCLYCANNVINRIYQGLGKKIRLRSVDNLISELVWAKKRYKIKRVTFVDDIFGMDKRWLGCFGSRYKKEVGLPYTVLTHPKFIDGETAKILKSSGCYLLAFGIQSANEEVRMKVLKRIETNKEIEKAARSCWKYKLKFSIDHIFNIPRRGMSGMGESLAFYSKLRPAVVNSYYLQYFPKTEIVDYAIKKGEMKKEMVERINKGLTSSSLVVGVGGKDSYLKKDYSRWQFYLTVLPLLPEKIMQIIVKKKMYLWKFRVPLEVNIGIKFLVNLVKGRGGVYWGIVKQTFYFLGVNLRMKYLKKWS